MTPVEWNACSYQRPTSPTTPGNGRSAIAAACEPRRRPPHDQFAETDPHCKLTTMMFDASSKRIHASNIIVDETDVLII